MKDEPSQFVNVLRLSLRKPKGFGCMFKIMQRWVCLILELARRCQTCVLLCFHSIIDHLHTIFGCERSPQVFVKCGNCDTVLPSKWAHQKEHHKCPKCGSIKMDISLTLCDQFPTPHEYLRAKVKDRRFPSRKNQRIDLFTGDERRKRDGKWMKKERLIDSDADLYKEKVTDPETGKVIHFCEEPLSKHNRPWV